MAQNVTKKLKGMNGHAVAVGYGSPNSDTGHVVLGSSKRCSVQAQEKLSKPFVSLGQDVTNRLKFKLKRLNLQPITCESPKGDDGRQVVLEASRGCSLLQAWEKHFKALDSAKILDSAGHDEHTVPVGLENPKGDAKHLVLEGSERSSFCVALEKHDKTLDNTACVKTLDSTGQDGHAVPVGVHSPKGEAWHPVSKRRSFRQAREKHVKTLDNTGQDLCPVPVGLDWPKSDARQSVLGASKRCLEAQEKLSKTPVEVGQTVAKKSKGLDGDAVSFGYDSSKDDARHLLLEASKSFLQAHEKLSKQLDNMGQDISKKLKFKIKLKKGLHGRVVPVGNDGLKGDAGKLVHEASKSVEQGTGGVTDGGENNKVDQCTLTEAKSIKPKLVRISVTDGDATESSSDEEAEPLATGPRVKKFINEIMIESSSTKSDSGVWRSRTTRLGGKKKAGKSELPETCQTLKVQTTWRKFRGVKAQATKNKFLGVRQRPWGRWAAEIREPQSGRRLWLGTFDTAQEAAMVYDKAALLLRGPDTFTNFTTSQVVDEDGRKLEEAQLK